MKKPLVSVCMITYGHVNYIKKAIESVLEQITDFQIELVVANDCSPDDTDTVVNRIITQHPKGSLISYICHEKNIGMMPNFKFALQQCQGKYIALLDGDDYWTDPLKLQKQVDFLEANSDYVSCFHPCHTLREDLEGILVKQPISRIKYKYTIKNLLTNWNIPTASIVFRNEKKLKFPNWFLKIASGDIALMMLLYESGKFKLLEEYMSVYRINAGGASNSHKNYRMIHYRAKLYSFLNEYFNYKYEVDIYDAFHNIYEKFSNKEHQENILRNKKKDTFTLKKKLISFCKKVKHSLK